MSLSLPPSFNTNLHFCFDCAVSFSLFPFNTVVFLDTLKLLFPFFNHMCVRMCACVLMHMDIRVQCLPLSPSTLVLKTASLPETVLYSLVMTADRPVHSRLLPPSQLWNYCCSWIFPVRKTQALTLGQQTPYQLSHFSSPFSEAFSSFCKCPSVGAVFSLIIWYIYVQNSSLDSSCRQRFLEIMADARSWQRKDQKA